MMSEPNSPRSLGPWWRLPLLLALVLLFVWLARDWDLQRRAPQADAQGNVAATPQASPDRSLRAGSPNEALPADQSPRAETVTMAIEVEGSRIDLPPVAWRRGMTIEDALREAEFTLDLDVRGAGATALLVGLVGRSNEGGEGRNWMYSVNGKFGDRSFAIYELQPGDQVLWSFRNQQ